VVVSLVLFNVNSSIEYHLIVSSLVVVVVVVLSTREAFIAPQSVTHYLLFVEIVCTKPLSVIWSILVFCLTFAFVNRLNNELTT